MILKFIHWAESSLLAKAVFVVALVWAIWPMIKLSIKRTQVNKFNSRK